MNRKLASRIGLIVIATVVVVAAGIFLTIGRSGSGSVERWIGLELQRVANSYLKPRLSFEELDYTFPATVSLRNLRLTADDPASPGTSVDILGCDHATLTLAEVPQVGKPIVIEKVILDRPLFSAVSVAPNSNRFVGFSDLLHEGVVTTAPSTGPSTAPSTRFSDVFRMRLVQIVDGRVVYDPRIDGAEPMEVDQISTKLNIEPADGGWYRFNTSVSRRPVFDISIAGQLNLDDFRLRDAAFKLLADLSAENLNYLPPQVRQLLARYEVQGALELLVIGDVPLLHPSRGELSADMTLRDAGITLGEYRVRVDRMGLWARLLEGKLLLPEVKVTALKGTATLTSSTVLNDTLDTECDLNIEGMQLQELLVRPKDNAPPKFAGTVKAQMKLAAPLRVVADAVRGQAEKELAGNWGSIQFQLTKGRLAELPLCRAIQEAVQAAARVVGADTSPQELRDQLKIEMNLTGQVARVTEITYISNLIAARGTGSVSLDRQLDLTVNAGPVEKMQQVLGRQIGGAIAMVTDRIVAYRVTGVIGDPQVKVQVAGGALDRIWDGIR